MLGISRSNVKDLAFLQNNPFALVEPERTYPSYTTVWSTKAHKRNSPVQTNSMSVKSEQDNE